VPFTLPRTKHTSVSRLTCSLHTGKQSTIRSFSLSSSDRLTRMPSYSDASRSSYSHLKPIVHNVRRSRDSSIDSCTSYETRSSTEGQYSTSSRSSMSHNSAVRVVDERSQKKHRVPDSGMDFPSHIKHEDFSYQHPSAEKKYVTTTSYRKVDVTQHEKARYEKDAPRSSGHTHSESYSSSSKRPPKDARW
jgi:hypothetical protein